MHQCDIGVKPLVMGSRAKPLKLEAILLLSEQYYALDYLIFWSFQIVRPLLLTCYIILPLMQIKFVVVIHLCWIIHVLGYLCLSLVLALVISKCEHLSSTSN